MAHILAIRFSALGDIAMAVPVLYSFAKHYPEHEVTFLSRKSAAPLFAVMPENVHFMGISLNDYPGIMGLRKLFQELRMKDFDAVADLHNVLRTIFLCQAFKHHDVPVACIDKGRKEKRKLVRHYHKELTPLTPSPERYALVFAELGFPFQIDFTSIYPTGKNPDIGRLRSLTGEKEGLKWIGIAPFAAHKGKIYPLSKMEKVIALLQKDEQNRIFLFGAGTQEKVWCKKWEKEFDHVISLVGCSDMAEELALMSRLDVMVTMDSANMHLASLVQTPVVSIWGATHPYAGFMGLQAKRSRVVQLDLDCRPCSIFGNKKCLKHNYACLWEIAPEKVVEAVCDICNKKEVTA